MTKEAGSALRTTTLVLLVALNVVLVSFFVLWWIADATSVNSAEGPAGFDPSKLLPNANLMWIAAHSSLLMLIAVDVCFVFS
ncbi:hypothetical protein ICL81_09760 [Leucobacter sp. cx-328]|uniref:hypothetical protein n=1 Tax=unclassified Leucobacter TaxID=2621730 RepID=UPI00165DEB4B|nr:MULTISPECIES: hypothetical protein [unclassified Leucobacter]MBC9944793.1 hypothetical protein [Leucobacter sp. cx-328]